MGRIALAEGDAGLAALDPRPRRAGHPRARAGRWASRTSATRSSGGRGTSGGWSSAPAAPTGRPSVLQYSSPDLRRWRSDGVLVAPEPAVPGPGGAVWECPQLFPLDGSWVLLVSVWDDVPGGVACAVGDYDGRRFTPRAWHRLAADPLYATTTFLDAAGRRCALSWLQEPGPADGRLGRRADGALAAGARRATALVVRPHPDVDSLRTGVRTELGPEALGPEPVVVGVAGRGVRPGAPRRTPAGGGSRSTLDDAGGTLLTVVLDPGAGEAVVVRAGRRRRNRAAASRARTAPSTCGCWWTRASPRCSPAGARSRPPGCARLGGPLRVAVAADGTGARLERLVVHGMERARALTRRSRCRRGARLSSEPDDGAPARRRPPGTSTRRAPESRSPSCPSSPPAVPWHAPGRRPRTRLLLSLAAAVLLADLVTQDRGRRDDRARARTSACSAGCCTSPSCATWAPPSPSPRARRSCSA